MHPSTTETNLLMIQMDKPTVGKRGVSMLLDHFCTCIILSLPVIPIALLSTRPEENTAFAPGMQFLFLGLVLLYFFKDSFGARSIAKRVTQLQVVDNKTGQPASVGKCFLRNLTIVFWPIEVLVTFFSPDRRIGDFIAGTRISNYPLAPLPRFDFEYTNRA